MTERDALYRAVCSHPHDDTPRMLFADHLEEYGEPERAEFIRVQCELTQPGCKSCGGKRWDMHSGDCIYCTEPIRFRECELFYAHRQEWFGRFAYLDRLSDIARGPYLTVSRGFPSHWYGPWEAWVGGECRCVHHVDETRIAVASDCDYCKGDGHVPGACHQAWKPSWTMECEACKGRKYIPVKTGQRCPVCNDPGRWRSGVGFEHEKICMSKTKGHPQKCSVVWEPGETYELDCPACNSTGRVPMPMPPDALPITDVTITGGCTADDLIAHGVAVAHGKLVGWTLTTWPGITFHLPQGAMR